MAAASRGENGGKARSVWQIRTAGRRCAAREFAHNRRRNDEETSWTGHATLWWLLAGVAVAVELVTGTFYLLMLALGLAAGALAAHAGAGRSRAAGRRRRWSAAAPSRSGTCSARARRAGAAAAANRDVNLDIGERVHVDAWNADGTAARAATAAPTWTARPAAAARPAPGEHVIARVEGNRLVARARRDASEPKQAESTPWKSHIVLLVIAVIFVARTIKVVPQQNAWVVERLGKYHAHADAGPELPDPLRRPRRLQALR